MRPIRLINATLATWFKFSSHDSLVGRDGPASDIPAAESTNVKNNSRLKRRRYQSVSKKGRHARRQSTRSGLRSDLDQCGRGRFGDDGARGGDTQQARQTTDAKFRGR